MIKDILANSAYLDVSKYAKYKLGLPIIDAQHQVFFMLLDEINSLNQQETNSKEIFFALERLIDYAFYHFDEEEYLMEQYDVFGREIHIRQHQIFRQRMADFQIAFDYQNRVLINQILEFMRKWLVAHILGVDRASIEAIIQKM